jgi:UTP--glucose-1-phosphate uridylyltransferase
MAQKVRKALIPVAGYGTRFLPQTKAMPKEMLPLVDKPIVQYVVEKAVEAGIEQVILVTGWHKRSIEDHFDVHYELETKLEKAGKEKQLEEIRRIANLAEFIYVRQKEARGNGDAILSAEHVVGDEPFLVFWGDEFIESDPGVASQLLEVYEKTGSSVFAGLRYSDEEAAKRFGFVSGEEIEDGIVKVKTIIEKPGLDKLPSNLALMAGFLFTPDIFEALHKASETVPEEEELVYADGVDIMLKEGKSVYAKEIKGGEYIDCGTKGSYMQAVVKMALKNEEIGQNFKEFLKNLPLD